MSSNAESAEQLETGPSGEEEGYNWQAQREYIMEVMLPICSCGMATGIALGAVLTSLVLQFLISPKTIRDIIGLKPTTTTPRTYFAYPPPANVCFTRSCRTMSYVLQSLLSHYVEPCDDFYGYVCGRYEGPGRGMNETLQMDVEKSARKWAEAMVIPKTGQTPEQKSVALLRACKATRTNNVNDPTDLLSFIAHQSVSLSGADTSDPFGRIFGLSLHYSLHFLFVAAVPNSGDLTPSGERVLRLNYNKKYKSWIFRTPSVDVNYYTKRLTAFGVDTSLEPGITGSESVVRQVMQTLTRPTTQKRKFTIASLDSTAIPKATWHAAFMKYASPHYTENDEVITSRKVLDLVEGVFGGVSKQRINLLVLWELIRQFGPYVNNELSVDDDDSAYYAGCDKMLEQVAPMSFYYSHSVVTPAALRSVGSLASIIQNGLLAWISTSTLVDKQVSLDNVAKVNFVLGFPEGFQTKEDLEMHWSVVPNVGERFLGIWLRKRKSVVTWKLSNPRAFLFWQSRKQLPLPPKSHVIGVPAMLLHNVLFREDLLAAVNYAGLGHLIATALVERFVTFKASKTLCKQTSWLLGLHIAHKAYLQNSVEQAIRLPVLGLSSRKLFFVSACLKTCALRGLDGTEENADCHDLVKNMQPFAETFECAADSNMNPSQKCSLS
ncbi:uncharacterized protein LOC135384108 [Ornithodoros turicata]|uniref:uncharacterized protein LOC135384108 n=1 Tax=Ornithodoros turicata TaxID=34597 RepID=UPI0031396341